MTHRHPGQSLFPMKLKLVGGILIGSLALPGGLQAGETWRAAYRGTPYNEAAVIPGRVECENYDRGGEGVAYHDTDAANHGSGELNPVNGNPLNEYRLHEGVDISYTKGGGIDDNPFSRYAPPLGALYVGWTEPGEWLNYTVEVKQAGRYTIALPYTANGDGAISLALDGAPPWPRSSCPPRTTTATPCPGGSGTTGPGWTPPPPSRCRPDAMC